MLNLKKSWASPELIILMKGSSEERVLSACKGQSNGIGETSVNVGCYKTSGGIPCSNCSEIISS